MENKNETLSKLYALRAGMSAISKERDVSDKLQKSIKQGTKDLENLKSKTKKQIENKNKKIEEEKDNLNTREWSHIENLFLEWESALYLFGSILGIPLSIGFGYLFYLSFFTSQFDSLSHYLFNEGGVFEGFLGLLLALIFLISPVLALGLLIATPICIVKLCAEIKDHSDHMRSIRIQKDRAPMNLSRLENEIKAIQHQLKVEEGNYQVQQAKQNANITDCIRLSKNIYKIISKDYSTTLDPRDWKHIDLIIFYFETGRADSMKEALQLVDRQVQNNAIVNAINMAGAQIENTIRTGLQDLQINMVKCFAHISGQLDQISQNVDRVAQGIDIHNAQLADISQKIDLNNALREKANTNSMQLMQDVNYMRNLAENAESRRRNGY